MKLDHTAITVHDLDLMMEFYMKYLDATIIRRYCKEGTDLEIALVEIGGGRVELLCFHDDVKQDHSANIHTQGINHLGIAADNLETIRERLVPSDVVMEDIKKGTAVKRYFFCTDPEGNRIEFFEPL